MKQAITISTAAELAREFNTRSEHVNNELRQAGIDPVHSLKAPRGTQPVYERSSALPILQARFAPEPPPAAGDVSCAKELRDIAQSTQKAVDECLTTIEAHGEAIAKLAQQNIALARILDALKIDQANRLNALQASIDRGMEHMAQWTTATSGDRAVLPSPAAAEPSPPKAPKHNPEPTPAAKPARTRVAVVGLIGTQKAIVEKEFKDVFDLRFFETDAASGRAFREALSNCSAAFLMVGFATHSVDATIQESGTKLVRVSGGITSLRDKLTGYYLQVTEKAPA